MIERGAKIKHPIYFVVVYHVMSLAFQNVYSELTIERLITMIVFGEHNHYLIVFSERNLYLIVNLSALLISSNNRDLPVNVIILQVLNFKITKNNAVGIIKQYTSID